MALSTVYCLDVLYERFTDDQYTISIRLMIPSVPDCPLQPDGCNGQLVNKTDSSRLSVLLTFSYLNEK